MNETKQSAKILKILRENFKAEVLNVHGGHMQMASWPDCYIAHKIFRGWVEWKGAKTLIQKDQEITIRNLAENGDTIFIVRFLSEDHYEYINHELTTIALGDYTGKTWVEKTRMILNTLGVLS